VVEVTQASPNAVGDVKTETGRDRVRRLFTSKMTDSGMRFRKAVSADDQRRKLDQFADDLAYMTDKGLTALASCMRTKGEGSARDFWPSRVSILGFAEAFEPRPIEELPGLVGWFVSKAGRAASDVPGRLVAEYSFWRKNKHPPLNDQQRNAIRVHAADLVSRFDRVADRERRGVLADAADIDWLRRFRAAELMLTGWVNGDRPVVGDGVQKENAA
jgi:hypothetical protein